MILQASSLCSSRPLALAFVLPAGKAGQGVFSMLWWMKNRRPENVSCPRQLMVCLKQGPKALGPHPNCGNA